MSQTESAPDATPETSNTAAAAKPSRNPVEKLIVWGVIIIGLLVVGIEARAKFGYDMTYNNLRDKLKEVDQSSDAEASLTRNEALDAAVLVPSVSEVVEIPPKQFGDLRVWHSKLKWFSLFKNYEITLVMDEDRNVLQLETPNPPEEEEPDSSAPAEGNDDSGVARGGGGPPPAHAGFGGSPQAGGPPGGGRGFGGPRGLADLIDVEEVQAELKVDEEQAKQLAALSETLWAESSGMRDIFGQIRDADESERANLFEQLAAMRGQMDARVKEALKEILNEEQMTRLQQIAWQQSRESPLLTEEVAERIGLTAEQQSQLKELSDELQAAMQDAERGERGAIRESFDEKFLAVLTEEQRTQWKSLLGEPFEMPAPTRGGGGPRGGGNSERPERPQRPE